VSKLSDAQQAYAKATKGTKKGHERATVKAQNDELEAEIAKRNNIKLLKLPLVQQFLKGM